MMSLHASKHAAQNKLRIIAVTGGKGGTGKTTLSVNIAVSLARSGKKVLLFDADLGLANIDVLLGIRPAHTILDLLDGHCSVDDICVRGPHGLRVIPGGSGIQSLATLDSMQSAAIIRSFSAMTEQFDFMLVDLASGISTQVMDFTHATQDIVIVICNDPASFSDSYAVIKVLHNRYSRNSFGIVVNQALDRYEAADTFSRFQKVALSFIHANLSYLGHIPQDHHVAAAARRHLPVVDCFPGTKSVRAFRELAETIVHWRSAETPAGGIQFFMERLTGWNRAERLTENVV